MMVQIKRLAVILCIIIASPSCSEAQTSQLICSPDRPGPSIEGVQKDSLPAPVAKQDWNIDDEWADIARRVPGGLGGRFFRSGDGQLTIYMVEPELRDEMLVALEPLLDWQEYEMVQQSDVRQGRWDFSQLYDWRRYIDAVVGLPESLLSIDLNESVNRIHYIVLADGTADTFATQLADANIPCELVVIEEGQAIENNEGLQ